MCDNEEEEVKQGEELCAGEEYVGGVVMVAVEAELLLFLRSRCLWWILACLLRSSLRANLRPHSAQANGFSPV